MTSHHFSADELRASVAVSDIVGQFVELRVEGAEKVGLCPFHTETTPSFKVNDAKKLWMCFGCGKKGGVIDFVIEREGLDHRRDLDAACNIVAQLAGFAPGTPTLRATPAATAAARDRGASKKELTVIMPVPRDAPICSFEHHKHGSPSKTWTYRNVNGDVLGYVCRFDVAREDGKGTKKEVIPRHLTTGGWQWTSAPKPRPIYGLPELVAKPEALVLIVEGEKAADAARELVPSMAVISWPGGGKAVEHVEWGALEGRKCLVWPDFDHLGNPKPNQRPDEIAPGCKTALSVADLAIDAGATAVRIVAVSDAADGWDAADALAEGWTVEQTKEFLKSHAVDATAFEAHAVDRARAHWLSKGVGMPPLPPDPVEPVIPSKVAPAEQPRDDVPHSVEAASFDTSGGGDDDLSDEEAASRRHFTCLGHDHGLYFYLAHGAGQVLSLSGAAHSKANLLMLAPLQWWEREFPGKKGADWDAAANALIRWSEKAGVYDPDRARGRGAWWDDGRCVLHLGDRIVIDNREMPLHDLSSRFIYEAEAPMRMASAATTRPLTTSEAHELVKVCQTLSWERPISAMLLAGWCVIAPICGALAWRPHIWITGGAGSGKSHVYDRVLKRMCGGTAVLAASDTTEAGLRQTLRTSARPVLFDEAEGETAKAAARIQNVMALMRQASSETSARILKGTATGQAQQFVVRSCFAFLSIAVGLQQHADMTRVTVLALGFDSSQSPEARARNFTEVVQPALEQLTPEYVDRFHARTLGLIDVIRKNAETFARAGAVALGTRRLGDQLGALLAGAYSLHKEGLITLEGAREFLSRQDWSEETSVTAERDELTLLSTLLQHTVRVPVDRAAPTERSVGELCQIASGVSNEVSQHEASNQLKRMGLKVEADVLYVANKHATLARILANTPWARNWGRILARLDGAQKVGTQRFGPGTVERAVGIPLDVVMVDAPPAAPQQTALEPF